MMTPFRNVLCPVDQSDFSRRALRYGAAIRDWYGADLTVMSVRPRPPAPLSIWAATPDAVAPSEASDTQARAALAAFAHDATGTAPSEIIVAHGAVVPEIVRVAHRLPADLIVIGTHGLGGFQRFLLGSVTEKLLRATECPVLTIPRLVPDSSEPPAVGFSTIVCGMDRSDASRRALGHALSIAKHVGDRPRFVLVHALEDVTSEEPRFAGHFDTPECWRAIEPAIRADYEALIPAEARTWCDVEVWTPRGKPYQQLLTVAKGCAADLLVVGTAGWSAPFGSTTQHVLREAECPVLVVPPADAPASTRDG